MSVTLLMDVHVRREVTNGLRLLGVDVLTAQEDDAQELSDPELLDRAGTLGRVLFSQDVDMLIEAAHRQADSIPFAGVIYAHQLNITIGQCVADLALIAGACTLQDCAGIVIYLPL